MIRPAHPIPSSASSLEGDQHWYDLPDDDVDPDPVEGRTALDRLATWRTTR